MNDSPTPSNSMPTGLWVAVGITALMAYRVTPLALLGEVGDSIPEFWGIAFRGDIFIGATAPFVAWLLWKRRDLVGWVVPLIWHWIGIKDFITGVELHLIQPFAPEMGDLALIVLGAGPFVHLVAVFFIVRHRALYLPGDRPS